MDFKIFDSSKVLGFAFVIIPVFLMGYLYSFYINKGYCDREILYKILWDISKPETESISNILRSKISELHSRTSDELVLKMKLEPGSNFIKDSDAVNIIGPYNIMNDFPNQKFFFFVYSVNKNKYFTGINSCGKFSDQLLSSSRLWGREG